MFAMTIGIGQLCHCHNWLLSIIYVLLRRIFSQRKNQKITLDWSEPGGTWWAPGTANSRQLTPLPIVSNASALIGDRQSRVYLCNMPALKIRYHLSIMEVMTQWIPGPCVKVQRLSNERRKQEVFPGARAQQQDPVIHKSII
jgi:hypothetical protein